MALGKPTKPDFYKNGIPRNSQIEQFSLKNQLPANIQYNLQPSIAANGKYVFILTGKSLIKIGTGFNGTLRGFVYAVNNEFGKEKNGWIGFCGVSGETKNVYGKLNLDSSPLAEHSLLQEIVKTKQRIHTDSQHGNANHYLCRSGDHSNDSRGSTVSTVFGW